MSRLPRVVDADHIRGALCAIGSGLASDIAFYLRRFRGVVMHPRGIASKCKALGVRREMRRVRLSYRGKNHAKTQWMYFYDL